MSPDESESLDNKADASFFLCLQRFLFLLLFSLIYLLELLSFDELDFSNDESDNDGSGSGSPGTCALSFFSGNSVGCVSDVGSGMFFPNGTESIGDVAQLVVLVPRGVDSKVGRLIGSFWSPKY